jgi:beta-galactosidase
MLPWHEALATQNIPVDIVHPNMDLSAYKVLIAPLLYQLTEAQAEALRAFVHNGGTLVMSYFSGIVDLQEHIWLGGYPALLRDVLGITVEEWQPLLPGEGVSLLDMHQRQITGEHWVDLLHVNGADVLAHYVGGFIDGRPAITRHGFGSGQAYYLGTRPAQDALDTLLREICASNDIVPLVQASSGVEASLRTDGEARYLFVINHTDQVSEVDLQGKQGRDQLSGVSISNTLTLEPYGVRILALEG